MAAFSVGDPIQSLFEDGEASERDRRSSVLTGDLARIYDGGLSFPLERSGETRPYVIANFVSSLDGVVSYGIPGQATGAAVSGESEADQFIMGLLRSCAGAVVAGRATVQAEGGSPRTPGAIFPPCAAHFAAQQSALGASQQPLQVILTGGGELDLSLPIFHTPEVRVIIAAPAPAAARLAPRIAGLAGVEALAVGDGPAVDLAALLRFLRQDHGVRLCLLEGGPSTFGDFLEKGLVDELFLTLSPRLAGRDRDSRRPGVAEGVAFSPDNSPRTHLASLKRSGSFLFSRSAIAGTAAGS